MLVKNIKEAATLKDRMKHIVKGPGWSPDKTNLKQR